MGIFDWFRGQRPTNDQTPRGESRNKLNRRESV